jgi:Phosphate transport (Pho88)
MAARCIRHIKSEPSSHLFLRTCANYADQYGTFASQIPQTLLTTSAAAVSTENHDPADSQMMKIRQHDKKWLWKQYRGVLRSFIFVGVVHLYLGKPKILVLQTLLPVLRVWRSSLFKVYVLRHPETASLKRPWKEDSMLQTARKLRDAVFAPTRTMPVGKGAAEDTKR